MSPERPSGGPAPSTGPSGAAQEPARRDDGAVLRVTRGLAIPLHELEWRFLPSGGPGGQHANRSHTRAEVSFDVLASAALGPRQRARLLARLGPTVHAVAGDERSQLRNRQLALERLSGRLAAALQVERPRVPTAPSASARARRLADKRRRSARKRDRARPDED